MKSGKQVVLITFTLASLLAAAELSFAADTTNTQIAKKPEMVKPVATTAQQNVKPTTQAPAANKAPQAKPVKGKVAKSKIVKKVTKKAVFNKVPLLVLANEAAVATYSYSHRDFKAALQFASGYFTKAGWKSFMDALTKSNNLNLVKIKKLTVSAVATGTPQIIQSEKINGIDTWRIELPMLIQYQNSYKVMKSDVNVIMTIIKTTTAGKRGFGITQFIVMPQKKEMSKKKG